MSTATRLAMVGTAAGRLIAMRVLIGISTATLAVPAVPAVDRVVVARSETSENAPRAHGPIAKPESVAKTGAVAPLDLSDRVIRQAVKDSIDPRDDVSPTPQPAFGAGPADPQARIDRAFARAQIPSCMTMEAWKIDPPMIGPISLAGTILAVPFLVRNIVTGKCRH